MKKFVGLIASLTIICAICAATLASVNTLTQKAIAKMQREKIVASAKLVMPRAVTNVEQKGDIFIGKNAAGEIIGFALEGRDAGGYGGDIVLMVGFAKDKKTIVCYQKLLANETPGLGSKLSDDSFAKQFENRAAATLAVKKDGGEIDAITSATITSRAVCRAIQNAATRLAKEMP